MTPSNQQSETNTSAAPGEVQGQAWQLHCCLPQRISHRGFSERRESKTTHGKPITCLTTPLQDATRIFQKIQRLI